MRKNDDPCEVCEVEAGTQVIENMLVCRKCAKKLKKKRPHV